MAKYLRYYETDADFQADYNDDNVYEEPWTSYTERPAGQKEYPIHFDKREVAGNIPETIWIDDFPDDWDFWADWAPPYDSLEDYLTDYVQDPESFGGNHFIYTGETVTYDGDDYYLYECNDSNIPIYGLMPTAMTYDYLEPLTTESDLDNRFEPFDYVIFGEIGDVDFQYSSGQEKYVMVKIEDEISPNA